MQTFYSILDLGTLPGGMQSRALGINGLGQVVGWASTVKEVHAFYWEPAKGIQDLGMLGVASEAVDINDAGQIVGSIGLWKAILWSGGQQELGTLGGGDSRAYGINNAGLVIGGAQTANNEYHAYVWNPNVGMQDLGTLGGKNSVAADINNVEQVVGNADTAGGDYHATLWMPQIGAVDLGTLGGKQSLAVAINDAGQVVGTADTGNVEERAFYWDILKGKQDLGTLGGKDSQAHDINSAGFVVGEAETANGRTHAFLRTGAGMKDLNDLVQANPGFELTSAYCINDAGQIGGYGDINGQVHAWRLTPVPPKPDKSNDPRLALVPWIVQQILFGIVAGSGGVVLDPQGRPVIVNPPNPVWAGLSPRTQDALVGLAISEIASVLNSAEARLELSKAALNVWRGVL